MTLCSALSTEKKTIAQSLNAKRLGRWVGAWEKYQTLALQSEIQLFWSEYEKYQVLEMPVSPNLDVFLEKVQTAFDPPPLFLDF